MSIINTSRIFIKESQDKQNYIDKIKRKIQATKDNKSGKQTINIEELEKEIKDSLKELEEDVKKISKKRRPQ